MSTSVVVMPQAQLPAGIIAPFPIGPLNVVTVQNAIANNTMYIATNNTSPNVSYPSIAIRAFIDANAVLCLELETAINRARMIKPVANCKIITRAEFIRLARAECYFWPAYDAVMQPGAVAAAVAAGHAACIARSVALGLPQDPPY